MAHFEAEFASSLIAQFETLEIDCENMFFDMVEAGAKVVEENVKAKMPQSFRESLSENNITISKVYKTPTDDGINCQCMITGYFTNRDGKKTPAPLVANMFEYGSSLKEYPKHPFFRSSFKKGPIEKAMLEVQNRYLHGDEE